MKRRDLLVLTKLAAPLTLASVLGLRPASPQEGYPSRPVRLVVPSVPGGVHDVIARFWAERVRSHLGTVVIDNRGGGGGLIGASEVARSAPDGYSLLLGSTTTQVLITAPLANPPYDPVKDFAAVTVFAYSSTAVVVHPSVPAQTLSELIAYAKANPGKLSYGSAGNGSITHLAGELFKQRAGGLDIVHVPYKGIGQVLVDLLSGQIAMMSANATAHVLDLHRAGKLRILAVNSARPITSAPELPISSESGLPGMLAQTTFGIFAPAGSPRPILERLNAVTQQVMAQSTFQNELLSLGFEPLSDIGPEKAASIFVQELVQWTPILRSISTAPGGSGAATR
ncbi:MAG: Bug family tripartite tricarboxylate transporter substrate binding protein [Xanthobacteraceae bacterium]